MNKKEMTKEAAKKPMTIFTGCKTAEEVVAAAKSHGLALTPEQAQEILRVLISGELSDEQLDRISGGYMAWLINLKCRG